MPDDELGPGPTLRARVLSGGDPLLLPGAPNALTARVIEEVGFDAVYLSGAGISNTYLGAPDVGLVTATEVVGHVAAVREAVSLPIVVDADTGFGNAVNVRRTVRDLERAGANAVQLEDQVFPKRCGHFAGKQVIATGEMVGKVRAAVDARSDENLLVIARTDVYAVAGLDAACERARRYLAAGADVAFVEAPTGEAELAEIPRRVPGPHVVNLVEGGLTPLLTLDQVAAMGFRVVLYANSAMRAAVAGMRQVLGHLKRHGDTSGLLDQMIGWQDRQHLVRKAEFDRLEARYAPEEEVSDG